MPAIFKGLEDVPLAAGITIGRLLNAGLVVFFARLLLSIAQHPGMLLPRYGRSHRLLGVAMEFYLMLGLADSRPSVQFELPRTWIGHYDIGISLLGFAVTYSAAREFGFAKSHIKGSEASGILDEAATVSLSEMQEHCFYQLLNLGQISYLYAISTLGEQPLARAALALCMLSPWLARSAFPVNAFSANYAKPGVGGSSPLIRFLYR